MIWSDKGGVYSITKEGGTSKGTGGEIKQEE
jgi:hypothetical protein